MPSAGETLTAGESRNFMVRHLHRRTPSDPTNGMPINGVEQEEELALTSDAATTNQV